MAAGSEGAGGSEEWQGGKRREQGKGWECRTRVGHKRGRLRRRGSGRGLGADGVKVRMPAGKKS